MRAACPHQPPSSGFTLLEVLLAFMVFSIAVVSLVEAINLTGIASTENRLESRVRDRLASLLLETTRLYHSKGLANAVEELDTKIIENGVEYHIQRLPLTNLMTRDQQPLEGLYQAQITASWIESGKSKIAIAETWFYPPLFVQRR